MTKSLFETAKPILETLQAHQHQAFYVGGAVRDYLMNKAIHDIDITTSATPDEIEAIFDKNILIGKEHGTIDVVYNGDQYEVTIFRAEGDYDDHRRPNEECRNLILITVIDDINCAMFPANQNGLIKNCFNFIWRCACCDINIMYCFIHQIIPYCTANVKCLVLMCL